MKTRWGLIVLIVVLGVAALAIGDSRHRRHSQYPPAESLAGPMSEDWRNFADQVDRICAGNFNAMQADLEDETSDSGVWFVQYEHQSQTYRDVLALGEAPVRAELFHRWVANVGRRAQMMRAIGQDIARGDQAQAEVGMERLDAAKIDANWLGQHFGLRICTSNGPGREQGEESKPYLQRVNDVCRWRNKREDIYDSRNELSPGRVIVLSRSETVSIGSIPPPTEQYGLRRRILSLKKHLDRDSESLFTEAQRHRPKFKLFWNGVATPRLNAESSRVQIELEKLGLTDCGNWGPAPASTLLPRS